VFGEQAPLVMRCTNNVFTWRWHGLDRTLEAGNPHYFDVQTLFFVLFRQAKNGRRPAVPGKFDAPHQIEQACTAIGFF
jgi:hypothetical protein